MSCDTPAVSSNTKRVPNNSSKSMTMVSSDEGTSDKDAKSGTYDLRKKTLVNTTTKQPVNPKKVVPNPSTPTTRMKNSSTPPFQTTSSLNSSSIQQFNPLSPSKVSVLEQFYQLAAPNLPNTHLICSICKETLSNNLETQANKVSEINKELEENIGKISLFNCHLQNFLLKSDALKKQIDKVNQFEEKLTNLDTEIMSALNNLKANITVLSEKPVLSTQPTPDTEVLDGINQKLDHLTHMTSTHIAKDISNPLNDSQFRKSSLNQNPPLPTYDCESHSDLVKDFLSEHEIQELKKYLETADLSNLKSREVEYFGEYRYNYGNITHTAKTPPPSIQCVMDKIKAVNPGCTINSCLVTKYANAESHCPPHSDNEPILSPIESIFTLSLGAQRKMKFTNITTHDTEDVLLPSNSLLSVSRKSQDHYLHEIPKDSTPDQKDMTRYSLTFRDVKPFYINYSVIIGDSNTRNIKFGTEKGSLGRWVPGQHSYAPRIEHIPSANMLPPARNFIIHCGINDLKDTHHTTSPSSLAASLESKCTEIHDLYPRSKIYLSPVLPTMNDHLNQKAMQFNDILFGHLVKKHHNLFVMTNINFLDRSNGLLCNELGSYRDTVHLNRRGISQLAVNFKNSIMRKTPISGLDYSGAVKNNNSRVLLNAS